VSETGNNRITLKAGYSGSARFVKIRMQGALEIIKAWIGCKMCYFKRLQYEKQIKALHLFHLLSLEMLHRRIEIEKQDFRKKSTRQLSNLSGVVLGSLKPRISCQYNALKRRRKNLYLIFKP
jgi:hypothetical protein